MSYYNNRLNPWDRFVARQHVVVRTFLQLCMLATMLSAAVFVLLLIAHAENDASDAYRNRVECIITSRGAYVCGETAR